MDKKPHIDDFDPNEVGLKNGHFIGLPHQEQDAELIVISVPWDVTVSSAAGTSGGPANVLACSAQLDLYDTDLYRPWQMGIFVRPPQTEWVQENERLRKRAAAYIDWLEAGRPGHEDTQMEAVRQSVNRGCAALNDWLEKECSQLLAQGKMVGLLGGEHSVPLGLLKALCKQHADFGILQIDAHQDLREAYEGFTYSHASIFYNALQLPNISKLVQVGIRDHCEAEVALAAQNKARIEVFYDRKIREAQYLGQPIAQIIEAMVEALPQNVYISFDIDGLDPALCPNTGTPVPGGLQFYEALAIIKAVAESGRRIIGFDLSEVAGEGYEWDGNVGARILYQLCSWTGYSQGKVAKHE